jgi:hypothetical protein
LPIPGFTKVTNVSNLDEADITFSMTDSRCKLVWPLVVDDPHIFVSFGLFLPI